MSDPVVDPKRCPLCGGDNACGIAAGAATCWCFSTPVPDAVRNQIPADQQGVACVCANCAAGRRSPAAIAAIIDDLHRGR